MEKFSGRYYIVCLWNIAILYNIYAILVIWISDFSTFYMLYGEAGHCQGLGGKNDRGHLEWTNVELELVPFMYICESVLF